MKKVIGFIFLLFYLNSYSQNGKIAFVNMDKVVDSLNFGIIEKHENEFAEELQMMKAIYARKLKETNYCEDKNNVSCPSDTAEFRERIYLREKQIITDIENKQQELDSTKRKEAERMLSKLLKKYGYSDWVDISYGFPVEYIEENDLTNLIISKLK